MSRDHLTISCVIVDPSDRSRDRIADVLKNFPSYTLEDTYASGEEAISGMSKLSPDVIFSETDLGDMTGFDLIKQVYPKRIPHHIFVTSDPEHALKAFEYFVFDYILKPFEPNRLTLSLMKLKEHHYKSEGEGLHAKLNALFRYMNGGAPDSAESSHRDVGLIPVKSRGRIYFIREEDIEYVVASGYYIEVHAGGRKHLLRQSLSSMTEELSSTRFLRIHRSVIINLEFLEEITRQGSSEFSVRMRDGSDFKISKSYKGEVFDHIGI